VSTLYANPWFSVVLENGYHHIKEGSARPGAAVLIRRGGTHFLFVRVNRPAVGRPLLEIPRGYAEPGESSVTCALREGFEETGYRLIHPLRLGSIHPNSGILRSEVEIFLAETASDGPEQPPSSEVSSVVEVRIEEARDLILSGAVTDGFSIAALAHYMFRS
jgi:ADP-ribose pyrophosphatase